MYFLHVDNLLVLSGDHQGAAKEFLDVCSETGRQLTEKAAETMSDGETALCYTNSTNLLKRGGICAVDSKITSPLKA